MESPIADFDFHPVRNFSVFVTSLVTYFSYASTEMHPIQVGRKSWLRVVTFSYSWALAKIISTVEDFHGKKYGRR